MKLRLESISLIIIIIIGMMYYLMVQKFQKEINDIKSTRNIKDLEYQICVEQLKKDLLEIKIQKTNNIVEKRCDEVRVPINVRTQGEPGVYISSGTIANEDRTSIMPLYARQLSTNKWNYYCETNDFQRLKVSIHNRGTNCYSEHGCSELSDGDNVEIPELGSGKYIVTLHQNCVNRYIPYISC
jgi:hypothetical protein